MKTRSAIAAFGLAIVIGAVALLDSQPEPKPTASVHSTTTVTVHAAETTTSTTTVTVRATTTTQAKVRHSLPVSRPSRTVPKPETTTTTVLETPEVTTPPWMPSYPPADPTAYVFLDGQFLRWNPCNVIHYAVDHTNDPSGFPETQIDQAAQRMSEATGVTFEKVPSIDQAQLIIRWNSIPHGDYAWADTTDASTGYRDAAWIEFQDYHYPTYIVTLHELGHVMGLGHSSDPNEVMSPGTERIASDLGPADKIGLAKLGRQPGECQ